MRIKYIALFLAAPALMAALCYCSNVGFVAKKKNPIDEIVKKVGNEGKAASYAYYLQGLEAKHAGDFKLAEQKLAAAAAADPESEEPLSALAATQLSMCKAAESSKTADKILSLNPNSASGLSLKAEATAYSRDYNSMMNYYEKAAKASANDGSHWLTLAENSFVFFGDQRTLAALANYLKRNQEDVSAWRLFARVAIFSGRYEALREAVNAIKILSMGNYFSLMLALAQEGLTPPPQKLQAQFEDILNIKRNPNIQELLAYGGLLLRWGQTEKASDVLNHVANIEPRDKGVQLVVLSLLLDYADYDAAKKWAAGRKESPYANNMKYMLAARAVSEGKNDEALTLIEECLKSDDLTDAVSYQKLKVEALLAMGKKKEAKELMDKIVEHSDDGEKKLRNMYFLSQTGSFAELKEEASAYIKAAPDNLPAVVEALTYLAEADETSETTVSILEELLKKNPDAPELLNFLGYVLAEKGKNLEYAECLTRRAYKQINDNAVRDSLAWTLFQQGDCAVAERILLFTADKTPTEAEILWHLAQVKLRQNKDADEAFKALEKADKRAMSKNAKETYKKYKEDKTKFLETLPKCIAFEPQKM